MGRGRLNAEGVWKGVCVWGVRVSVGKVVREVWNLAEILPFSGLNVNPAASWGSVISNRCRFVLSLERQEEVNGRLRTVPPAPPPLTCTETEESQGRMCFTCPCQLIAPLWVSFLHP